MFSRTSSSDRIKPLQNKLHRYLNGHLTKRRNGQLSLIIPGSLWWIQERACFWIRINDRQWSLVIKWYNPTISLFCLGTGEFNFGPVSSDTVTNVVDEFDFKGILLWTTFGSQESLVLRALHHERIELKEWMFAIFIKIIKTICTLITLTTLYPCNF